MTFEEAKKIFLNRGYVEVPGGMYYDADKWRESVVVISKWLEQEACEGKNCISRQAVLDTLNKMDKALDDDRSVESYKALLTECYKDLPSVIPLDENAENNDGKLRTKGEQIAYLDGYKTCAEGIKKYLTDEGKQKLDCLITAVENAVENEDGE